MEIKKGIGVSPGVVIGTAVVLDAEDLVVPRRQIDAAAVPHEVQRLHEGVKASADDWAKIRADFEAKHGGEIVGIFDAHVAILKDKSLLKQLENEIQKNHTTAEYAVSSVMRRYANQLLQSS